MRAVEHSRPRPGNPDASRSVVPARGAGASAARVAHGPGGRGTSAGSGFQPRGPPPHATVASRLVRSSGCRDRSGYTAPPAGDSARTGIAGPVDPCAPAGIAEGAGRTRPSGPNYVGTAFIGTVQDTARSQQLLGEWGRCRVPLLRRERSCTPCAPQTARRPASPPAWRTSPTTISDLTRAVQTARGPCGSINPPPHRRISADCDRRSQ